MIGLIFATQQEAGPFLALDQATPLNEHPFKAFRSTRHPYMVIAISGMGKVAAAVACQALLHSYAIDHMINAGACGGLHDRSELEIGRILRISKAVEGDYVVFGKRKPVECAGMFGTSLPMAKLVTCDQPVFEPHRRHAFSQLGDVVDMEGAAVARVAALYGIPCDLIKGVSDYAGPTDRKTLQDNLKHVSEQIARVLWDLLSDLKPE